MITYVIKIILCSALFLILYKVLFEREKMHLFNRFYLLSALVLSLVIPLMTFNSSTPVLPAVEKAILNNKVLTGIYYVQQQPPVDNTDYYSLILLSIYLTITILLFYKFIINLAAIFNKISHNTIVLSEDVRIVLINEDLIPHSFLNYIFVNKEDYSSGGVENEVLIHELLHVKQKHSLDILFVEVIQVFFWFNPFLFFYKKAIRLNHEFLADEAVINTCHNIVNYQYLLINKAKKQSWSILTSPFNYLTTKKRLIMMTKTRSFVRSMCKQVAVIPVLAVSIFLFSTKSFAQKHTNIVTVQVEKDILKSCLFAYWQLKKK